MLGDMVSGPGHDKTSTGRNVERVLTVTPCPHDVDGLEFGEVDRHSRREQVFPEACQLLGRHAAHPEDGHQRGQLCVGEPSAHDVAHESPRFVMRQRHVLE